ncbi:DUF6328 family protein [Microlunatus soli]|uniref:Sodium:proton antiporter n=1 Tax=Microlunatus soli TaxID=630515 RepID=A0A1H1N2M2_9ACTN|nr:DUF6328 family protein [Microlunatus soli]SDR93212.1 hypothetical protein SAMN04489812_0354 [Microlunatus soli]
MTPSDPGGSDSGRHETDSGRHETDTERYDRNWRDIQQELRITQTGTQLLAGFLMTLPFQQRFSMLTDNEEAIYLALVLLAAGISILALAPVSAHRVLFRQHRMSEVVRIGNLILIICMIASAVLFAGTVLMIFDVVLGESVGLPVAAGLFIGTAVLWLAVPLRIRSGRSGTRRRKHE